MSFELLKELVVVRKAHDLALDVYRLSGKFPKEEQFGMTSQIRRAAVSVPTNICEGRGRGRDRELGRFLLIAKGSLLEVQYLLTLARDLNYVKPEEYTPLLRRTQEVERMLVAMLANVKHIPVLSLRRKPSPPLRPDPK